MKSDTQTRIHKVSTVTLVRMRAECQEIRGIHNIAPVINPSTVTVENVDVHFSFVPVFIVPVTVSST